MEWFWQLIDRVQKTGVFSVLQSFQPIDWIFLFLILWGLGQGSRKGFCEMFGKLLGIFLISMLTLSFYGRVAAFLSSNISFLSLSAAKPFALFLLTIFLWLSVSWCLNIFGKFFKMEAQGMLKTLGGMVLGGARMMLLMSFLAQFLLLLPIDAVQNTFKPGHTYTGYTIARLVPDLHKLVVDPFLKSGHKQPAVLPKTGG
jgi:uncharacterized membrane protein required for colicin V production